MTTSSEEVQRGAGIAVLPVGSFEQHGGHLPLATDSMIAVIIAQQIAETYDLFLLPAITIACSHEHAGWPGTVSISATTLHAIITDIASSLASSGIHRLLIVNGHGGNYVLSNIVQEASITEPRMALFPRTADWTDARAASDMITNGHDDMHAGELETSILLHALPQTVRPEFSAADFDASERPHLLTLGLRAYTGSGVIGRPSLATADKGKLVLEHLVTAAADYIAQLKK
jgi:creatinine amidohydrolase